MGGGVVRTARIRGRSDAINGNTERWVGIDVAKAKLDVAWLDERGKIKNHVFSNDAKGHAALSVWLRERAGASARVRVCMEATGPYGEAPATALADAGFVVSVVNPARIKGFAQGELDGQRALTPRVASGFNPGQSTRRSPPVTCPRLPIRIDANCRVEKRVIAQSR